MSEVGEAAAARPRTATGPDGANEAGEARGPGMPVSPASASATPAGTNAAPTPADVTPRVGSAEGTRYFDQLWRLLARFQSETGPSGADGPAEPGRGDPSASGEGRRAAKRAKSFEIEAARLSTALLSERGEVLGTVIARDLVELVRAAPDGDRLRFLGLLAERYDPSPAAVAEAADRWRADPSPATLAALSAAVEPPRQELFRRMNMAPEGTATLVGLRETLLAHLPRHPALASVDADLRHLFGSWFNRGFLELRAIDWGTSAAVLEKLIAYEAVHAIDGWDDLRRRLAGDRRCFGFFHPALRNEPLIFVEVALLDEMADRIEPIIRAPAPDPVRAGRDADVAIFYSISNCQPGLRGVSFGNLLIKQVVSELARELPGLSTFATLSPIPGFRAWLARPDTDLAGHLTPELRDKALAAANGGDPGNAAAKDLRAAVLALADADPLDPSAPHARGVLCRLAARYLAGVGNPRGPTDPVARFHLGNGARIERVNWAADLSRKGRAESAGLMVNYLYDLDAIAENHDAFANRRPVAVSRAVASLIGDARSVTEQVSDALGRLVGRGR